MELPLESQAPVAHALQILGQRLHFSTRVRQVPLTEPRGNNSAAFGVASIGAFDSGPRSRSWVGKVARRDKDFSTIPSQSGLCPHNPNKACSIVKQLSILREADLSFLE